MRTLFELDAKDYDPAGRALIRPSVRGIILRDHRVAMVHSRKYNYYKLPGGGMEAGESQIETLIREVREESGLTVRPETVRPYGMVSRKQKSEHFAAYEIFVQENYHYLCEADPEAEPQKLDAYEQDERFTLEWMDPREAIAVNRSPDHGPKSAVMIEREARVLECLIAEGYFD